jgi:endoglucanase
MTRHGKYVNGVFAGLSVHLQPGRLNAPKMNHVEDLYVDIGASSAAEVRAAGVDLLDPIALQRKSFTVGDSGVAGPAAGEGIGVNALLELLGRGREIKAKGTTTIAFVTQQWTGGRGLNRLLTEIHPDEMVFVGRVMPAPSASKDAPVEERKPGSGVVLGVTADSKSGAENMAERLKAVAEKEQIPLQVVNAAAPRIAGYAKSATLPENFVEMGVPELWPITPAETVARGDAERLQRLLSVTLKS